MKKNTICTFSGRSVDELSIQGILSGDLKAEDFRIHGETLNHQARVSEEAGYTQLAENLRIAAELTHMSNEEILDIYNTLRPRRTSYKEMIDMAERLQNEFTAPLTAAFVREAAAVYLKRGIVKEDK
ncbi:MAG: diol dehydratase small subunit [Deltaproteobacteria bacterium]|jgi:propanediol dehydratase small subunit|nr:diol dehydratase small subunit [Deltaproteobacteria bacterium]